MLHGRTRFFVWLPGISILLYLSVSIGLFFFGPVQWNPQNVPTTMAYLVIALILFATFYTLGLRPPLSPTTVLPQRKIIVVGGLLSIAMLLPSAYFYAGKMPWDLLSAIRDQKQVYAALQSRLSETQNGREIVALARALTFPLIYAAVPLCILNFRRNPNWFWALFGLTMASAMTFSILRGTDRESFDFILLVASSALVLAARNRAWLQSATARKCLIAVGLCGILVLSAAYHVFGERRLQRADLSEQGLAELLDTTGPHGGYMTVMCIRTACADKNHWMIASVPPFHKYAITMATNYLTNGYYGLSLALADSRPFHSTLGIGHAPALKRVYERITHDEALYRNSYTFGLNSQAWSDNSEWSTIFPWLANDVGFAGALAIFAVFGFIFAMSWRDATLAENDAAAIVFCFLMQLLVYVPANFQIGQTLDSYLGCMLWLAIWLASRHHLLGPKPTSRA